MIKLSSENKVKPEVKYTFTKAFNHEILKLFKNIKTITILTFNSLLKINYVVSSIGSYKRENG